MSGATGVAARCRGRRRRRLCLPYGPARDACGDVVSHRRDGDRCISHHPPATGSLTSPACHPRRSESSLNRPRQSRRPASLAENRCGSRWDSESLLWHWRSRRAQWRSNTRRRHMPNKGARRTAPASRRVIRNTVRPRTRRAPHSRLRLHRSTSRLSTRQPRRHPRRRTRTCSMQVMRVARSAVRSARRRKVMPPLRAPAPPPLLRRTPSVPVAPVSFADRRLRRARVAPPVRVVRAARLRRAALRIAVVTRARASGSR